VRLAAVVLAVLAVVCLGFVIAHMAAGSDVGRRAWFLRGAALVCFAGAVLLNVIRR
jgi:hypothetical protein